MGAVAIEQPVKTTRITRERVRDGMATAVRLSRQVFEVTREPKVVITLALVLVLTASAIGVVISSHQNRELFNTLSGLQEQRDGYQREWSQLLLEDRKSTRLNSSHVRISYAVFCLKKKK